MGRFLFLFSISTSLVVLAETPTKDIQANAIELEASLKLPNEVLSKLEKVKIITIGEIHGNDLSPKFVARLVEDLAQKHSVVLALEIPQENQKGIDQYLKTGNEKFLKQLPHFTRNYQDGRSSVAMADLIHSIRKRNVSIFAFDPNSSVDGQDRDTKMAMNLASAIKDNSEKVFVIYAGNLHMALKEGNPLDSNYRPAAYQLFSMPNSNISKQDIFAINIRYATGTSWMCFTNNADECGAKSFDKKSNYSDAVGYLQYFLVEPKETEDGYLASLFLRNVNASKPFVK